MKRISSMLLAIVLLISLAACDVPASEPEVSSEPTTTPSADLGKASAAAVATMTEAELAQIFALTDARRESIINSKTAIIRSDEYIAGETYTDTAYFISNSGSDDNNGLSPETAFATPGALKKVDIAFGDAVFFERGGLWRAASLPNNVKSTDGVTISAYGEGEKPKLYASPESGVGAEKWTLAYDDQQGKKIWSFYRDTTEVGAIVLNGETVVSRDVAWWNGNGYMLVDGDIQPTDTPYTVNEHLENMWCFPDLRYPDSDFGDHRIFVTGYDDENGLQYVEGTLYFRCDEGNPGTLFEEVEFISPYCVSDGMANSTVYDNLCIMYSTNSLVTGYSEGMCAAGCVIQNCEVGWMGGAVTGYATFNEQGDTRTQFNMGAVGQAGGGICVNGSGATVRGNYVHNAFQKGINLELFTAAPASAGNRFIGNLVEECVQSILFCNWDMEVRPDHMTTEVVYEDNIALYTGTNHWYKQTEWANNEASAFIIQGGPCAHDGTVSVRNNIFALSANTAVLIEEYSEEYSQIFSGNTYIQYVNADFVQVIRPDGQRLTEHDDFAALLGDSSAVVGTVARP